MIATSAGCVGLDPKGGDTVLPRGQVVWMAGSCISRRRGGSRTCSIGCWWVVLAAIPEA